MICNTCKKEKLRGEFDTEKTGLPRAKCKECVKARMAKLRKITRDKDTVKKYGGKIAISRRSFKRHFLCRSKTCINGACDHHRGSLTRVKRDLDQFHWLDIREADFNSCKKYIPIKEYD